MKFDVGMFITTVSVLAATVYTILRIYTIRGASKEEQERQVIEKITGTIAKLVTQKAVLEEQVGTIRHDINKLETEVKGVNSKIDELNKSLYKIINSFNVN